MCVYVYMYMCLYIYVYDIYIYIYVCVYVRIWYIYIYIERERDSMCCYKSLLDNVGICERLMAWCMNSQAVFDGKTFANRHWYTWSWSTEAENKSHGSCWLHQNQYVHKTDLCVCVLQHAWKFGASFTPFAQWGNWVAHRAYVTWAECGHS